jgi:hypothetical protein
MFGTKKIIKKEQLAMNEEEVLFAEEFRMADAPEVRVYKEWISLDILKEITTPVRENLYKYTFSKKSILIKVTGGAFLTKFEGSLIAATDSFTLIGKSTDFGDVLNLIRIEHQTNCYLLREELVPFQMEEGKSLFPSEYGRRQDVLLDKINDFIYTPSKKILALNGDIGGIENCLKSCIFYNSNTFCFTDKRVVRNSQLTLLKDKILIGRWEKLYPLFHSSFIDLDFKLVILGRPKIDIYYDYIRFDSLSREEAMECDPDNEPYWISEEIPFLFFNSVTTV